VKKLLKQAKLDKKSQFNIIRGNPKKNKNIEFYYVADNEPLIKKVAYPKRIAYLVHTDVYFEM